MTHSDDDGLVLPPRLAPAHVVILPIYRNDQEKADVLAYCDRLQRELADQRYNDDPIRVRLDDRDIRGGEKTWQHIKRGVPLRLEIGPRDVQSDSVFLGRRDRSPKDKAPAPRGQFVAQAAATLAEMQAGLLRRAIELREANSVRIDSLKEFEEYFTPQNAEKPEIHGGFAWCHFVDNTPEMKEILARHKVSVRCLPVGAEEEPGRCIFTGQPSRRRGVFAKAY
jgi:prolyl-tRNA synthetase